MTAPATLWPPPEAWPANLLRFHLAFPRPMDAWQAMQHLALEAAGDAAPAAALLDLQDGLWTPDQTRLTVLLHPGRVKAGIGALGPALRAGGAARLRLRAGLADAEGVPLGRDLVFAIALTPAVRTAFVLPAAVAPGDPAAPVALDLGRPLDLLGVAAALRVEDAGGRPVAHRAVPWARGVVLHPAPRWPAGALRLAAAPWLEDACGNHGDAPFEATGGSAWARSDG